MRYIIGLIAVMVIILSATPAFAGSKYNSLNGYTQDTHGSWESNDNAFKDSDGDGVVNHYDSNNKNSSVW